MDKYVPMNKRSKREQREVRKEQRVMFSHQNCPISHKSAKDYNRKKVKESLKNYLINY